MWQELFGFDLFGALSAYTGNPCSMPTAWRDVAIARVPISTRWQPGQVERRDVALGTFEMVNSRMDNVNEKRLQRALIGDGRGWIR